MADTVTPAALDCDRPIPASRVTSSRSKASGPPGRSKSTSSQTVRESHDRAGLWPHEKPVDSAEGGASGEEDIVEIIVDWEGEDDPQNPKNWKFSRKWAATIIASSFTFISPVSSSMIAPAAEQLAHDFGITSSLETAMVTSIFVLGYAVGPLLWGPLSEIFGRSRILQASNLWYLAWNIGCGFSTNTEQLIAFRFLAGLGGSAPLAIGGGVMGDTWRTEERGQALAAYSLAPLLGPVVGPVCGSWIVGRATWRWVFWSTSIIDALIQLSGMFFLQETFAPVLLERKAARIRKSLDPEKARRTHVRTVYESADRHWKKVFQKALIRPFMFFLLEPIIQLLGLYNAFIYGLFYLFLTTIPTIFRDVYAQSPGIAGLHYIALGIGLSGASQTNARFMDQVYIYCTKRYGGVGKPEYRLPSLVPGTIFTPIGLLIAGWAAQAKVHWIVTDIGIAFVGAGTILNFQGIQAYVIDAFTLYAASGIAATVLLRSLAGFGFPLFAPAMYQALGYGKANTMLAIVGLVIGGPSPWLFWFYGERIRKASRYADA